MNIQEFVSKYSKRGACTCGECFDAPPNPEEHQPKGHTADMEFFKVALNLNGNTTEEVGKELQSIVSKEYPQWLDGKEHGYMEIGGDVGDQGRALCLMGIGSLLGLWELLTPSSLLPDMPEDVRKMMAGQGMVSIRA